MITITMNKKSFMLRSVAVLFGAMLYASCTQTDIPVEKEEVDPNEDIKGEVVYADNFTDLVKTDGWGGAWCATQYAPAISTADGRSAQMMENYQGNVDATGVLLQQTITGLENGKYKVMLFANAFYTSGRGFDSPMADGATDVAYVFANDTKKYIEAHIATATPENGMYEFEVDVTNNTLTLGLGKDKAGTNWHTIQIGSLYKAMSMAEAYDALVDEAQMFRDEKISKQAFQDLMVALSAKRTVDSYYQLYNAVQNAVVSAQSYDIVEGGVIPSDRLEGWTCTNAQGIHINTWSVEGNPGNDPTGMVTPFIENWVGKNDGTLGDGEIYYELPGLEPNRVYYASIRFRAYSEAGNDLSGMSFFIGDQDIIDISYAYPFVYNGMKGAYATFWGTGVTDEYGVARFGFKLENASFNWLSIKDVEISM